MMPMMQLTLEQQERLIAWAAAKQVRLCVLFGSRAMGRARLDSDVDLAVWPKRPFDPTQKLPWIVELETLLDQDVSLVLVSADLDPVLGWEIARNGRLLYEQADHLWMHHRAQLWHAYNDSWRFRQAAREQLHRFAEEIRRGS